MRATFTRALNAQAEQRARSLAEDAIFAQAWQQRVKELKEEEGAEAAERLAEVRQREGRLVKCNVTFACLTDDDVLGCA